MKGKDDFELKILDTDNNQFLLVEFDENDQESVVFLSKASFVSELYLEMFKLKTRVE